ncbi:Dioxygenase [Mesorhizobium albiziae]|uniref:Dioxygenase n=1 Tax=Neomesorhizobium albiziae TaxID=335020 RepID=A0A1I4CT64_9HYPH|nr:intradiol ring-cleavage dioxygenase [Mesorhizobium albiziae]SFK84478.1 Dioxygenase [Mesorhizobium albiziae]
MPTRRTILSGFVAVPIVLPRLGHTAGVPKELRPTPDCVDDGDPTPAQTEGPYFTPKSPEKRDFASDAPAGERITIAGYVLTRNCEPVEQALVELWHADQTGTYDNTGFKLRGHQFTDAEGRWWFDTIVPGLYPGRTRHYHLKVQRPGGRVLTTQLYFPNEPENNRDFIFDSALLLDIAAASDRKFGRYNFVVG